MLFSLRKCDANVLYGLILPCLKPRDGAWGELGLEAQSSPQFYPTACRQGAQGDMDIPRIRFYCWLYPCYAPSSIPCP